MPRSSSRVKSETALAITSLRASYGESMQEFAVRMKVALNTINRYENSYFPPSRKVLEQFCNMASARRLPAEKAVFSRALELHKQTESGKRRNATVIREANLSHMRSLAREFWQLHGHKFDLIYDKRDREVFLALCDHLLLGKRAEVLELTKEDEDL